MVTKKSTTKKNKPMRKNILTITVVENLQQRYKAGYRSFTIGELYKRFSNYKPNSINIAITKLSDQYYINNVAGDVYTINQEIMKYNGRGIWML